MGGVLVLYLFIIEVFSIRQARKPFSVLWGAAPVAPGCGLMEGKKGRTYEELLAELKKKYDPDIEAKLLFVCAMGSQLRFALLVSLYTLI